MPWVRFQTEEMIQKIRQVEILPSQFRNVSEGWHMNHKQIERLLRVIQRNAA